MIKKYKVDYDFKAEVVIEIDDEIMTEEKLAEINDFWGCSESRVKRCGSVLNAVLKMLMQVVLRNQVEYGYNTYGIVSLFDFDECNGGIEGWPKMDGSHGIKLISVDDMVFDYDDMSISTIK